MFMKLRLIFYISSVSRNIIYLVFLFIKVDWKSEKYIVKLQVDKNSNPTLKYTDTSFWGGKLKSGKWAAVSSPWLGQKIYKVEFDFLYFYDFTKYHLVFHLYIENWKSEKYIVKLLVDKNSNLTLKKKIFDPIVFTKAVSFVKIFIPTV